MSQIVWDNQKFVWDNPTPLYSIRKGINVFFFLSIIAFRQSSLLENIICPLEWPWMLIRAHEYSKFKSEYVFSGHPIGIGFGGAIHTTYMLKTPFSYHKGFQCINTHKNMVIFYPMGHNQATSATGISWSKQPLPPP